MEYAVFIDGIRGGTIKFNNTKSGEFLKKQMQTKLPNVSVQPLTSVGKPKSTPKASSNGSIGAMMVRRMIEQYERNNK